MTADSKSRLKRPVHAMPVDIAHALRQHGLEAAYEARPPYQRNDYIGWINAAKLDTTRAKRLQQMLEELRDGTLYMNMDYVARVHVEPQP